MRALAAVAVLGAVSAPGATDPRGSDSFVELRDPGGLRTWRFPSVSDARFRVVVLVSAGSRDEEPSETGLAHLVEHCLFRSTTERATPELLDDLRRLDVRTNAMTTADWTAYQFDGAASRWRETVALVGEMLARPAFLDEEVRAERRIVLEEIDGRLMDIEHDAVLEVLYPDHPVGRSVGGTSGSVSRLRAQDARRFHEDTYRKGNIAVAWSGAVEPDALHRAVGQALADLPEGASRRRREIPQPARGVLHRSDRLVVDGEGAEEIHLGWHVGELTTRNLAGLLVLEELVSESLFDELRTREPLSYFFGASYLPLSDAWRFEVKVRLADGSKRDRARAAIERALALPSLSSGLPQARAKARDSLRGDDVRVLTWAAIRTACASPPGRAAANLAAEVAALREDDLRSILRTVLVGSQMYDVRALGAGGSLAWIPIALLFVVLVAIAADAASDFPVTRAVARRLPRWPRPRTVGPDDVDAALDDLFRRGPRDRDPDRGPDLD